MSDTPCTCQANHAPLAAGPVAITLPTTPTGELDPAVLDRVVASFTAAAADSADTRFQELEARFAELEQVVASMLADHAQSSMQPMPA